LCPARKEICLADVTSSEHAVIQIHEEDILHITARTVRIEADKILNDVKKREIPRFRQDPPAPSVATAIQQLIKVLVRVVVPGSGFTCFRGKNLQLFIDRKGLWTVFRI
jgi:hypothetical protein